MKSRDATIYIPLVPKLSVEALLGGLGSGLSWGFGADRIFDEGRKKSVEVSLAPSRLAEEQTKEELAQLVAAARSAADRLASPAAPWPTANNSSKWKCSP